MILDTTKAFGVSAPGGKYHADLVSIRHSKACGIYAIIEGRRVLYVGESHSGRLYDTITRHFRDWKIDPSTDALGRRRGGTTYDRYKVRVVFVVTEPDTAQTLQYAEIERLRPRDNSIDGKAVDVIPVSSRQFEENPPRDENERRGRAAMRRVLKTRQDEWDAMDRPGLGSVAFVWGVTSKRGTAKGVRGIVAKGGAKLAMMVPVVIARGEDEPVPATHAGHRQNVTYRGYMVTLSMHMHGRKPVWVLTAWKGG